MNLSIMAPNHHFLLNALPLEPVSRTYQYRKIMKPMLERKRRARINKCLDELKSLMTGTLQADGENVSKLEKADILELTVRHLHRLREHNALFLAQTNRCGNSNSHNHNHNHNNSLNIEKFWAGFQHCAAEVSQFLNKYDRNISGEVLKHIAGHMPNLVAATTTTTPVTTNHVAAPAAAVTSGVPTTTTTNYQRRQAGTGPGTGMGPIRMHLQRREGQSEVNLEPYARQREEFEGVWRPW